MANNAIRIRPMTPADWPEVADLIHLSTNAWYRNNGKPAIFGGDPAECEIFCSTYDALDPGQAIVAESARTGRIVGSCFLHPRPTHLSIGIVNVHPNAFGKGVGRSMLAEAIARAEREDKPLRLVSSAMNLDSFSLYTRAGFVPRMAFQDMLLPIDAALPPLPESARVRPALPGDAPAMAALETEIAGIARPDDYRHFLENRDGIWSASVLDGANGLDGFLVSVGHSASNLLGPGVARTEDAAAALIRAEHARHPGRQPVFLVPVEAASLVRRLYAWGAKNCEIHFAQIRGKWTPPSPGSVVMPTFLPESG